MSKKRTCLCLFLSFLFAAISLADETRQYSRIITVNDYTYEIEVEGFRDPVNETIIIENLGNEPIVNPRITVNGRYDWFDAESIAGEATAGCATDKERALSIFNFVRNNGQHISPPGDRENLNPVVYFNVYGYGICSYSAANVVALNRAAGLQARVWEVWHHTVPEIRYNNAWHMLDSDIQAYFLMDDNRTLASIEQLAADQLVTGGKEENAKLTKFSGRALAIQRRYTDVEGNIGWEYRSGASSLGARYFFRDHFYVQRGYDYYTCEPHSMAMTLRPNEKLIRNWKGGDKYYDYKRHNARYAREPKPTRRPIRYGDGKIIWKPDLTGENAGDLLGGEAPTIESEYYTKFFIEDGVRPAIHVKHKHGGVYDTQSFAMFSIHTPYTIIGGGLKARVYRGAATDWDRLGLWVGNHPRGRERKKVWGAKQGETGYMDLDLNLDEALYPSGNRGAHNFSARFQFSANEANDPPTQTGIESVKLTADIQCAPNSLPALSLGRNIIRYRDETPGPHKVKISHIWRERNDNHPPSAPRAAKYPADGKVAGDLSPHFRWSGSRDKDKGDRVVDYMITISFDSQCRWPISTSLLTETGSGKPAWQLDQGWLNRDTRYYWRVKAR
ncbi:MAG: transglutaminase-like domain-containing protein, partial [Gemmatimonadota bacterium]|nr:transglutaminase-like domain-containing protein [Gemmatimonadota bacterium]